MSRIFGVGINFKALLWLYLQILLVATSATRTQTAFHVQGPSAHDRLSHPLAWDLGQKPSINDTSNLVFESVNSLLQHWPNTRYRNGHSLVAGTIPPGTLLYHGTYVHEVPKTPEWAAMDPEHSYLFCHSISEGGGCWHLTLITTRTLKILYFDGNSAAKIVDGGAMDSQDLVAWGKIVPEWVFNEKQRILDLCAWGEKYGIDGYVRMEMDFEVMLCSFTEGVKTVSFLYLASDNIRGPPRHPPHDMVNHVPVVPYNFALDRRTQAHDYRVIEAGSWHNRFPGDIRIKLDYTRLISFYDTASFPSLEPHRFNQERFFHRLDKIQASDVVTLSHQLDEILGPQVSPPSGIEWRSLFHVITNRYAERLEMLQYTLNTTSSGRSSQDTIEQAFRYVRSIIVSYIVHKATPSNPPKIAASGSDYTWAQPVFEACVAPYSYSHIFRSGDPTSPVFSRSEELLASSAEGVVKEICRVLVRIWGEGVELGFSHTVSQGIKSQGIDADEVASRWFGAVSDLIHWLDWSYWVRCNPSCSHDETCYLPTWPYFTVPGRNPWPYFTMPGRNPRPDAIQGTGDVNDEPPWLKPQPKCILRVEPFGF